MKNDLIFPSYTEFIQRSEMIKSRQERLIQVRQQSKKVTAEFLENMKKKAEKQYEKTEQHILNEICELHSKELAAMRSVYEECVMKINQEHYTRPVTNPTLKSFIQKNTDDFLNSYTQRVHDRIRILDQREKMLQRRAIFLPELNQISISRNQNGITSSSENKVPHNSDVNPTNVSPHNSDVNPTNVPHETESPISESEKITLSAEKIIRAATNEYGDRPHGKKLHNWRKLFTNGERLSESSYYSPPTITRNQVKKMKYKQKKCEHVSQKKCKYISQKKSEHVLPKNTVAIDESENDIGYYVAKLLLMSPGSIENLNCIDEETVSSISVDEIEYEKAKPKSAETSDGENIDEEEFIRRMLDVNVPCQQTAETIVPLRDPSHDKPRISVSCNNSTTITETDVKSRTSSMSILGQADNTSKLSKTSKSPRYSDKALKKTSPINLKLDSRLSSWIGTSIRRTVEASAVNSTSSYDETDNLHNIDKLVETLIGKSEYFLSGMST